MTLGVSWNNSFNFVPSMAMGRAICLPGTCTVNGRVFITLLIHVSCVMKMIYHSFHFCLVLQLIKCYCIFHFVCIVLFSHLVSRFFLETRGHNHVSFCLDSKNSTSLSFLECSNLLFCGPGVSETPILQDNLSYTRTYLYYLLSLW